MANHEQWVKEAFASYKVFLDNEVGGLPMMATVVMKEEIVKEIDKLVGKTVREKLPRKFLLLDAT